MHNLRALLIQRAARLQERPAFTAPAWGSLNYSQFRNRAEGVALGLLALDCPTGTLFFSSTGSPWDWASEVAVACCGFQWESTGTTVAAEILGGAHFNDENGRGPYHERDRELADGTLFSAGLDHATMLQRLQRMNRLLGWDHESVVSLPLAQMGTREIRAALWCVLYAGSHAILQEDPLPSPSRSNRRSVQPEVFEPAPFYGFWD